MSCDAETAVAKMRAQKFHWNATGMAFGPFCGLFQETCKDHFVAQGDLVEGITALDDHAEGTLARMLRRSKMTSHDGHANYKEMRAALVAGQEASAATLVAAGEITVERGDTLTEDLAIERGCVHEEFAWLLRSHIKWVRRDARANRSGRCPERSGARPFLHSFFLKLRNPIQLRVGRSCLHLQCCSAGKTTPKTLFRQSCYGKTDETTRCRKPRWKRSTVVPDGLSNGAYPVSSRLSAVLEADRDTLVQVWAGVAKRARRTNRQGIGGTWGAFSDGYSASIWM